jgi:YD repeat-containing protein
MTARRTISGIGGTLLLLAGTAAFAAPAQAVTASSPIDLGTLPGFTESYPAAISDAGTVVGMASADDGARTRAVRWDSRDRITALDLPNGSTTSAATAINNHDVIAGYAYVSSAGPYPVRWDQRGRVTELEVLPGSAYDAATGINDAGIVVGQAAMPGEPPHTVRWDAQGHVTDLGVLPGRVDSRPSAINDRGMVAGSSCMANGGCRAVRWGRADRIEDLGTLPGDDASLGDGMSRRGTVIGRSYGERLTAVWWNPDGRITAAAQPWPDTTDVLLSGINRDDLIVGTAWRGPNIARAARWGQGNHVTVMESLASWTNTTASYINDVGNTAGMASMADQTGVVVEWDRHGRVELVGSVPAKYYGGVLGLNNAGTMIGWSRTPDGHGRALLWRK